MSAWTWVNDLLYETSFLSQLSCSMPDDVQGLLFQPTHDSPRKNGWSSQLQNLELEARVDLSNVGDRRFEAVSWTEGPEASRVFKHSQTCKHLWRWYGHGFPSKDFHQRLHSRPHLHAHRHFYDNVMNRCCMFGLSLSHHSTVVERKGIITACLAFGWCWRPLPQQLKRETQSGYRSTWW